MSSSALSKDKNQSALRADTLADSVVILLVLTLAQRAIGLIRSVLFCRWLEPSDIGQWDVAFGFLMLAAPLAVLGLPGSFGRYAEYYRQRGQLRPFLRRMTIGTVGAMIVALVAMAVCNDRLADQIFGSAAYRELSLTLVVVLSAVIAHNFFTSLFTALRMYRVVSRMQFLNTIAFALVSLALIRWWKADAISAIAAYGLACLLSTFMALATYRRTITSGLPSSAPLAHGEMWAKLLPFAMWMWTANFLANLFAVADRYMIVHFIDLPPDEALMQVGQYHSSRVVPWLFVGIAELMGAVVTPHLSHDWEIGRREDVSRRLNLFLKMFAILLVAASIAILFAAPLLFSVAFAGKFAGGEHVLPWTLTYCVWTALTIMAQNYLWCAEKARLASAALAGALVVNVVMNWFLLPVFGLMGAVLATSAANLVALALVLYASRLHGMRIDRGTLVMMALPAVFWLGPWISLVATCAVVAAAALGFGILSRDDRHRLAEIARDYLARVQSKLLRRKPAAMTSGGAP